MPAKAVPRPGNRRASGCSRGKLADSQRPGIPRASLAAIFFAAALLFAFFFGTVNPRLRQAQRRYKRLKAELASLRAANKTSKDDLASGAARIIALEHTIAAFEKEVHRLDGIRRRTDTSLLETKALLERLQTVTAHVDMP